MNVSLRPLEDRDLDTIYQQVTDPESVRMAAFTAEDQTDRRAFLNRQSRLRADTSVSHRVIDVDGAIAGTIASFRIDDQPEVTYWIDRTRWGRGIASAALQLLLAQTAERPLYARAASDNVGSLRVLEKAGFRRVGVNRDFAPGRGEEIEETIRTFKVFCQESDWRFGFHQALPDFLPIYRRLGFKKLKIGDDAIVDLTRFSLEGRKMREFRNMLARLGKSGIQFRRYDPPIPREVIHEMRDVSNEWLRFSGRRERQFSLGMFQQDYVGSTSIVAATDVGGRIVAFVNIVPSYRSGETTIDLMRRRTEAPNGIMDFLFVNLFLESREKGFTRFNFGLAPMSGFAEQDEGSREERAIHAFFQRLNFLFSYRGLRSYKAKFASSWEPRYLVYRNALDLPRLAIALSRISERKD